MGADNKTSCANVPPIPCRRRTVKTGCRTCKIRKVKCDEGRPACRRCVSTGRVCDGYGIWGGGGNFYGQREKTITSKEGSVTTWPPRCISILTADAEERRYFEWFKWRTVKKVPGYFVLPFWDTLLFQACLKEPAVLHAMLTLSSTHKMAIVDGSFHRHGNDSPDRQEQFMLQQYLKATNHLRPHLFANDKSSIRISLIACILFVSTELFRGRFQSAQTHLGNGLRIMREVQTCFKSSDRANLGSETWAESIDGWIQDAFSRFQLQVALFDQNHDYSDLILPMSSSKSQTNIFLAPIDAWLPMQNMFNRALNLSRGYSCPKAREEVFEEGSNLISCQQDIQKELICWLEVLESSKEGFQVQDPEGMIYQLLRMYYEMAKIMTSTSLSCGDEAVFDGEITSFISLMEQATEIWAHRSTIPRVISSPKNRLDMCGSVLDMGWIPPLYYTALKCRVHRIRMHAVRLLEMSSHREGMWDSRIAAAIARKIVMIEESDFYEGFHISDDFSLTCSVGLWSTSLPALPAWYRVSDVNVDLPNGPKDNCSLSWRRRTANDTWEAFTEVYNLDLQAWSIGEPK